MDKYKNWKTTSAFFVFLICFIYAVVKENVSLAEATGFIALISWIVLKVSTETLNQIAVNITEVMKKKWSK